jgi:hypothetical protein
MAYNGRIATISSLVTSFVSFLSFTAGFKIGGKGGIQGQATLAAFEYHPIISFSHSFGFRHVLLPSASASLFCSGFVSDGIWLREPSDSGSHTASNGTAVL